MFNKCSQRCRVNPVYFCPIINRDDFIGGFAFGMLAGILLTIFVYWLF